jgi:hypothetical protein
MTDAAGNMASTHARQPGTPPPHSLQFVFLDLAVPLSSSVATRRSVRIEPAGVLTTPITMMPTHPACEAREGPHTISSRNMFRLRAVVGSIIDRFLQRSLSLLLQHVLAGSVSSCS